MPIVCFLPVYADIDNDTFGQLICIHLTTTHETFRLIVAVLVSSNITTASVKQSTNEPIA